MASVAALVTAVPGFSQALLHGVVQAVEAEQQAPVREAAVRAFVDDEAIAVAFTDREGRYTLEVPAETFELRLVKLGYVVAQAGGVHRPTLQRTCPAASDCGRVDFLLERSAAIEVWLTDPSGDPFPGALVELTPKEGEGGRGQKGETDDRGVERFYGLRPGRYRLDLHPDARPAVDGPLFELDSTELALRPGENTPLHVSARRAGTDTFSLSAIIEGVDFNEGGWTLNVQAIGGQPEHSRSLVQRTTQLSIPRLPRGEYVLELVSSDLQKQPILLGRLRLDEARAGVILRPAKPAILVGHAVFEDDAPDHANLALRSEEGWTWRTVHVEKDFPNFNLTNIPPGSYTLVPENAGFFLTDLPSFHLAEGVSRSLQVTLSVNFARISGAARSERSEPIQVELSGPMGRTVTAAGRNGAFAFEKLVPGEYSLCAAHIGGVCSSERIRRFPVEAGDDFEIDVRVGP